MATATTTFFNTYASDLHSGNIDWSNIGSTYDYWLFNTALAATNNYTFLNSNKITTNLAAGDGGNNVVLASAATVNTNGYRVDLQDIDIVADGGTVTFTHSALIADTGGGNYPVCFWDWGGSQQITNSGTATFTFDANGLFTFSVS